MSLKEEFLSSCLILDTETTSDDYKTAEIIESGFVIRENNDWTVFQELHNPVDKRAISPKVQSISYITNKMLEDKPSFVSTKDVFQEVVNGYKNGYLVAHNHFYDMKVLENHGIDTSSHNWLCSWRMSKKLFNGIESIEETNLPYLRFALELDVPIEMRCHRAGNDSFITAKLLEVLVGYMEEMNLIDKSQSYGPQILKWMHEPIIFDRMPFGKHKNELMSEVPRSYFQWAVRNMDSLNPDNDNYDSDLAESIRQVYDF